MDSEKPTNDFDKWCVLLDSKAHLNGDLREEGRTMTKEKLIISPTRRRSRASGKPFSKWDVEVNLRFFDRETIRSDLMHTLDQAEETLPEIWQEVHRK